MRLQNGRIGHSGAINIEILPIEIIMQSTSHLLRPLLRTPFRAPLLRTLSTSPPAPTGGDSSAPTPPKTPRTVFSISHQPLPSLPSQISEILTLDRSHDPHSSRPVSIKQKGRSSMTSSMGGGKSWTITFANTPTTTTSGKSASHAKDMWTNPLMKYQSSSDPLGSLTTLQAMSFESPEKAMRFCLKRGWDYRFDDFPQMVFKDDGSVFEGEEESLFKALGVLNEKSLRVKEVDGELVERETFQTYKIPPYFDEEGKIELYGSHSTSSKNSPNWPENDKRHVKDVDNWGGYDENFLPKAVKHKIGIEGLSLDYYSRDESGTSHYFRPLRYHGDGVVPQWGPEGGVPGNPLPELKGGETESGGSPGYKVGKGVEKDVEGWKSRR
ncbi:hypothetical protein TrST_g5599 [Triparma strigata]|uniref:NADH dehydrogenase [ubiquinone] iron-sulfur protein 4, mitochondrial n=1 Tax=Triparma strigata TaxID=1606541 RepID=A0A9W7B727_9STRA|nr:hypothetical protein TrST_g5599 [Triparma strigata]